MTNTDQAARYLINGIDPYEFEHASFRGASIHFKPVPWSSVIHFKLLFGVGAMHDSIGKEGTAHFLEHMIFQGNPLYQDKFQIDEFSKKYTLDSLNAFTSFTKVCVHFRCLPEHASDALEGVYQMLAHSYLREEDIENERSIITQEAWSRYTNPKHMEYVRKERANTHQGMPDRLRIASPLGWPETVAAIQKGDLEKAKEDGFVQENLTVIVAGATSDTIMESVRSLVSRLPSKKALPAPFVPTETVKPIESIWIYRKEDMGLSDSKQAQVSIGSMITKANSGTGATRTLASKLLYELMFKKIRHGHSWCYKVHATFGSGEDASFGEIGTTIDPEHVIETLKLMREIVRSVEAGEHRAEFEQEKQLYYDRRCAAELTTSDIAEYAIDDIRFDGKIQNRKDMFAEYEAVSYEDIVRLMSGVFEGEGSLIDVIIPDSFSSEELRKKIVTEVLS